MFESTREKNNALFTRKYVMHFRLITQNNANNYALMIGNKTGRLYTRNYANFCRNYLRQNFLK